MRKVSPPKLSDILYLSERKDKALGLMKMIELGFLPSVANPSEMKRIEEMHSEEFLFLLSKAAKTLSLQKHEGAFSTAMIDFGGGPVECVIKVGVGEFTGDKAFDYLRYCKGKGGREYCTAFPDVYYLGRVKTVDKPVDIAVLEFVTVMDKTQGTVLSYKMNDLVDSMYDRWGLNWQDQQQVDNEIKNIDAMIKERSALVSRFGWTIGDVSKFIAALGAVGGSTDIKWNNFGLRRDHTVCVFDPISQ